MEAKFETLLLFLLLEISGECGRIYFVVIVGVILSFFRDKRNPKKNKQKTHQKKMSSKYIAYQLSLETKHEKKYWPSGQTYSVHSKSDKRKKKKAFENPDLPFCLQNSGSFKVV